MAKVYVKLDENNTIVEINSNVFLSDVTGWTCIDEGDGDKYAHAQGNYLTGDLTDDYGRYNYKLYRNKIKERTEEEKGDVIHEKSDLEKFKERLENLEKLFELFKGVK